MDLAVQVNWGGGMNLQLPHPWMQRVKYLPKVSWLSVANVFTLEASTVLYSGSLLTSSKEVTLFAGGHFNSGNSDGSAQLRQ